MEVKVALIFLNFMIVITPSLSARILGVVPTPSYSHQVAFYPLWKELSLRGHEVILLTTNPIKDPSLKNLTEIDLNFMYEEWTDMDLNILGELNIFGVFHWMNEVGKVIIDKELAHPEVQKILKNEKEQFDIVLVEPVFPGMIFFAERFKCPLIQILSLDAPSEYYYMYGNPVHPVLNPDFMLPFYGELTFMERLISTAYVSFSLYYNRYKFFPTQEAAAKKHFGENYPNAEAILSNASLMFVNTDSVLHSVRPLLPNVIQIGGGTHVSAPKPLPKVSFFKSK